LALGLALAAFLTGIHTSFWIDVNSYGYHT